MNDYGDETTVIFTINGKVYKANSSNAEITMSLNSYIREVANLKGTKYMCREGGCGACIVSMTAKDPHGKKRTFAINSCLVPVLSCHGTAITTVEGIGNRTRGYHPVQSSLAIFNGTQCGYCSPGQVMNMYSLLKSNPNVTKKEVENAFGSNICRCTGYRPILDAFKSLASDAPNFKEEAVGTTDIEDLMVKCTFKGDNCKGRCDKCPKIQRERTDSTEDLEEVDFVEVALAPENVKLSWNGYSHWFRVKTVSEIFQVFDLIGPTSYRLVAGNTAQGVYRDPVPQQMAAHIELVAHIPVRNVGTIAGNLSIKHQHREFPSDIFLILETAGATLIIEDQTGLATTATPMEYLDIDMRGKLITKVILHALSSEHYYFRTYKIMPRSQNVHALVNAGFLFKADLSNNLLVSEKPKIVYGAINPNFVHAAHTESFWLNKSLRSPKALRTALTLLLSELKPDFEPTEASQQYRQLLAVNLFYRFVLNVDMDTVSIRNKSGGLNLKRPLSSGVQVWDTNKKEWPVHKPLMKLEAFIQCSGEAEFVDDMPKQLGELYGALVFTDRASSTLQTVDTSKAMVIKGVVAYISAIDIPGVNTFIGLNEFNREDEELFCSGRVIYAGQPVGMIVATTQTAANMAARLVTIKYGSSSKPVLTVEDAIRSGDKMRVRLQNTWGPVKTGSDVALIAKGTHRMEAQYHYTMELQGSLVVPKDDGGFKIYSSTQWIRHSQSAAARALGLPMSSIEVEVKRCGGAFGSRITKCAIVSTACAVAAYKLQRPVRMVVDMETNFKVMSHRYPNLANYEVAVNKFGKIQYLNVDFYENYGCSINDDLTPLIQDSIRNCYDWSSFRMRFYVVITDLPSTTWMRAPGTLEGISLIEQVMEHIAQVTALSPMDVRTINLSNEDRAAILEITGTVRQTADYDKRIAFVNSVNQNNRWKKRGISLIPMKFSVPYFPNFYAMVSVYADDGTVAVTTGGIEVGQGINTKVAQVCAYALAIDIRFVKVRSTHDITSPNNFPTANSIATDCATYATLRCCQMIQDRLQPLRARMKGAKWVALTQAAAANGINLNASHMYSLSDPIPQRAPIYGATALEVEVDVLTGQYQILRVDILEDCGESLNPLLDVGQVEGAFVMGLGYYHSEELKRDPKTGALLTFRTWTYWPPGAKDIPVDFRVMFRRNSTNPKGVLGSKATGEPPLCMTMSLQHALRQALRSARVESGLPDEWFDYHQPCTFEKTLLTSGTSPKQFNL
ncbi:hypothetical protein GE061_019546 [Apolygus lucorum]|uniref:FAD-binding PCMH-type domain-containing protein n=1 Tax=Apolygus lucorum TaxID=248454 RepID=A0A8S9XCT3_APOLU|nr:hypothetical protein GE061_019546 [Apolygus lucorum]